MNLDLSLNILDLNPFTEHEKVEKTSFSFRFKRPLSELAEIFFTLAILVVFYENLC